MVDEAGKAAFDAFRNADVLSDQRKFQRPYRRWKGRRHDLNGPRLERWFLKTTINLSTAQESDLRWLQTDQPLVNVPTQFAQLVFRIGQFVEPMGLYSMASIGELVQPRDEVSFAPLVLPGEHLAGGLFTFRGHRFMLYVGAEQLPKEITLPGPEGSPWQSGQLRYHIRRHRWKIGKWISHYVQVHWTL